MPSAKTLKFTATKAQLARVADVLYPVPHNTQPSVVLGYTEKYRAVVTSPRASWCVEIVGLTADRVDACTQVLVDALNASVCREGLLDAIRAKPERKEKRCAYRRPDGSRCLYLSEPLAKNPNMCFKHEREKTPKSKTARRRKAVRR